MSEPDETEASSEAAPAASTRSPEPPPAAPLPPDREVEPAQPPKPDAQSAGRGGIAIIVAKVSFILFGFGQQLILPKIVGAAGYGVISQILATVSIVNNVIVALAIQGVSRSVASASEKDAPLVFRRTLLFHTVFALGIATGFAAVASAVANAIQAPTIVWHLRAVALVVLLYGIYAPLVGWLNGRQRFVHQATLDILYGGLRFTAMVGGALVASRLLHVNGVWGAVVGFVLAAISILPVAFFRTGTGKNGGTKPPFGAYAGFTFPLLLGLSALNLLLFTDFLLFSRFNGQKGHALGLGDDAINTVVGGYRAFQLFSFLPYQLVVAVSFVLFPLLARARVDGDREAVRRFTRTGVRLAFLFVGLIVTIVAALPTPLLEFAFTDELAKLGAKALPYHALGMACFAMLSVFSTALTSLGREIVSSVLTILGVVFVGVACFVLTPRAEFGTPMMVNSALATLIGLGVTAAVAAFVLFRTAGGLVNPLTFLRVGLAVGATILLGTRIPYKGRLLVPLEALAVALVYLGVLVVTRELGGADFAMIKSILRRKKPAPPAP